MTQSPRTNCPVCGKRLLGQRNVRMHVAEKHPDHAQASATSQPAQLDDAGHPYGLEHPVQP